MPDFDPKNIPVLDDIIEDDDSEKAESVHQNENPDALHPEENQAENNLDLLSEDSIQSESEVTEPYIDIIHDVINEGRGDENHEKDSDEEIDSDETDTARASGEEEVSEPDYIESDDAESALIDSHDEENNDPIIDAQSINPPATDNQLIEPGQQVSLQPIVEDIVKQLMPDLEQQLRFLVEQALQDRLPAEIIKQDTDD